RRSPATSEHQTITAWQSDLSNHPSIHPNHCYCQFFYCPKASSCSRDLLQPSSLNLSKNSSENRQQGSCFDCFVSEGYKEKEKKTRKFESSVTNQQQEQHALSWYRTATYTEKSCRALFFQAFHISLVPVITGVSGENYTIHTEALFSVQRIIPDQTLASQLVPSLLWTGLSDISFNSLSLLYYACSSRQATDSVFFRGSILFKLPYLCLLKTVRNDNQRCRKSSKTDLIGTKALNMNRNIIALSRPEIFFQQKPKTLLWHLH
ncbi:hypothetical protein O4H49_04730, partial [Kiloniella laminariae]